VSNDERAGAGGTAGAIAAAVLLLPFLVFLPPGLAILEGHCFGTSHVEQFFERVGLHDFLGRIYDATVF
jgi:hypothetical protein